MRIFITAQEIIVDNASYPIKEIAENSHIFRTLGLGYANLGSLIMSYGYGYDSVEGRALCGAITAIMTGEAYEQSARMAARDGTVPRLSRRARQRRAEAGRKGQRRLDARGDRAASLRGERNPGQRRVRLFERGSARKSGTAPRSSASATVIAMRRSPCSRPTGTISFLMDCDTTGIEPDIALVKYKLLAGGGMFKIVNQTVKPGAGEARLQFRGDRAHHRAHRCVRHDRGCDRHATAPRSHPA